MIYLPTQRDDDEESDGAAAVWAFLLTLFFFKVATVVLIFWHMRTWEAGRVPRARRSGTSFRPWSCSGPARRSSTYRLRKVRARREALRRAEWMELEPVESGVRPRRQR